MSGSDVARGLAEPHCWPEVLTCDVGFRGGDSRLLLPVLAFCPGRARSLLLGIRVLLGPSLRVVIWVKT